MTTAIKKLFAYLATIVKPRSKQSTAAHIEVALTSVTIAPGDTLVLTTPLLLTAVQRGQIQAQVDQALPGVRAMVLTGGLRAAAVLTPR